MNNPDFDRDAPKRNQWNVENYEDRVKDYRSEYRKRNQNPTEEGWMERVKENVADAWEDTKDAASEAWQKTKNWVDDTWDSATNEREDKSTF